jgi:transcriptional regulator with XRE-family HTH domain
MHSDDKIASPQLSDEIAASPELMREFQKERLATEVSELVSRIMREKKMSRAELAARLGKSRPFVTKLLRTGANMTVRTLADVFYALGFSLRVVERPLSVFTPRLFVMEVPGADRKIFNISASVPCTFTTGATFTTPLVVTEKFAPIPSYFAARTKCIFSDSPDGRGEAA